MPTDVTDMQLLFLLGVALVIAFLLAVDRQLFKQAKAQMRAALRRRASSAGLRPDPDARESAHRPDVHRPLRLLGQAPSRRCS